MRALSWDDLGQLMHTAKIERTSALLLHAKRLVANANANAKADWPELLKSAPETVQRSVTERLNGGVRLAAQG